MNHAIPTRLPRMMIGRASDMTFSVQNISVRTADREAFLGIVARREKLRGHAVFAGTPADRAAALAESIANHAFDARSCAKTDRAQAIHSLETAAALAIAAIIELKGAK